jgi:hypothetical protein
MDGEVPRLGCVEGDDSLVIEVHNFVVEPNCEECARCPKKFNDCLDSVNGATGHLGFEWCAVVVDEYFNVVDRDFGGEVERDVGSVVTFDFAKNKT